MTTELDTNNIRNFSKESSTNNDTPTNQQSNSNMTKNDVDSDIQNLLKFSRQESAKNSPNSLQNTSSNNNSSNVTNTSDKENAEPHGEITESTNLSVSANLSRNLSEKNGKSASENQSFATNISNINNKSSNPNSKNQRIEANISSIFDETEAKCRTELENFDNNKLALEILKGLETHKSGEKDKQENPDNLNSSNISNSNPVSDNTNMLGLATLPSSLNSIFGNLAKNTELIPSAKSPSTTATSSITRPHPYKTYSDEDRVKVGSVARKLGASIASRYFGIPESTVRHFRDKFDKYAARNSENQNNNNTGQNNSISPDTTTTKIDEAKIDEILSQTLGANPGQIAPGDQNDENSINLLNNLKNGLPTLLGKTSGIKRDFDESSTKANLQPLDIDIGLGIFHQILFLKQKKHNRKLCNL